MPTITKREAASVVYHDIFDYPLTKADLKKWLVSKKAAGSVKKNVDVVEKEGFYFVKEKSDIIKRRVLNEKYSKEKLGKALKLLSKLSVIPTIDFVGITGALAMLNADERSDIDALIITKKSTLWTTRLVTLLYLKAKRVDVRRFNEAKPKDKLCLNIWISQDGLSWPKNRRNIFTAHEILQIIPVINKNKTFERFLLANKWVLDYWPKALLIDMDSKHNKRYKKSILSIAIGAFIEPILQRAQLFYMRNKRTKELVETNRAFFHPVDWSTIVDGKLR